MPNNRWLARILEIMNDLEAGSIVVSSTAGTTPITPTHAAVNVNGDTVVIAANADRRYLLIINDSDTDVYLNLGAAAVVNTGIRLNAGGGSYEIAGANGNLYRGAINANHGGGAVNKVLLVTEGV